MEPPNILIDQTSATGFTNIGFFHQQSDINNNWVSSSIGGSVGALATQNNQYLVDGLLLSGSVEKLDSLVEFRTKNSFDLEKDVDYVVRFDSYFFKDIAEYKSDQDTISTESRADLKVFLSGSGLTGNAGEEDYYLGKVEIPTNSNDEGEISNVVGSFRSAGSGSPKAWLKFKLNSGRFIIKDASIEPFSEENFNPNYFRTIVPMPGLVNVKRSRLFDFRAEFYDVNNNEADVGATLERVNFDGTPTIVQGLDNKITGSVMVGESLEMYGTNPAYLRSVGYQGFAHTIANNKGGFLLFSGSIGSGASGGNRLTASEAYQGVGLEIVDAHTSTDRFLKFRTDPSTFQVVTDEFLLGTKGSTNNYISGSANGKLEISSSNFELNGATGNVILQGTITAQAGGTIGGFTIGSASMFSGAEATPTFFLSGSGHSGTNFVKSNLFISSSGFQVNSTGAISASLGRVGGFTITDTQLSAGDDTDFFGIIPGTGIQMGDSTFNDAKFSVTNAGALKSTSGTIGGFTITSTELFSLDSGTPDSSPNNGITIDTTGGSNSKAVIKVFDGTTENAALGNFASGKFGIKAIEGDIGGFTIDSDEIKSTNLLLDSSNEKITLGSANAITLQGGGTDNFMVMGGKSTFDQTTTAGVIIGMDATVPKLDLTKGTGNDNYLRFDGSNGLDIKTPSFKLDTDRLDIDSSTSRISVFDDAGSPKEVVRIGEVDGASNFGMKIFDGTGTADSDILVEFSETTNNIAGWTIGTSTIQGGNLVLNKEGTIESADFSSGNIAGSGTGFRLSALDNGFLEVENARIRGTLSTAVFEKETVNAVGGQLLIGNSTTITGSGGLSGVTASSATMSVANVTGFTGSYNGFNAAGAVSNINNVDGEILIIKKVDNTGFSTEYVCVNSASRNTPSDDNNLSGLLYVTRSFGLGTGTLGAGPGSNFTGSVGQGAKNYEDGQVIVSTGRYISGTGESTVGTGYINLNARPTDGATPYIDIVERTGSKVYEMDLKARLGDLSGISTAKVGSSPGFGLFTDRAFLTKDVTVGTLSGEHVLISGSYLAFKNNNSIMAQLEGTTWTLGGQTGTTEDAIKIAPGGVFIYDNSNDYVKVTSDGLNVYESGNNVATFGANSTITGGSITLQGTTGTTGDEKVVIENNSISMFTEGNEVFDVTGAVMTIGSSTDKVTINGTSGITIRENNSDTISMVNGVVTIGSSTDQVEINGTSGITIRENNKDNITLTDGTIKVGVDENDSTFVQIDSDSVDIIEDVGGTNNTVASFGVSTTIGSSTDKVSISDSGITIRENNKDVISLASDVVTIGSSTDKVTINGTSGITIRENNADSISLVNGVITVGSSTDKVTINGTSGITIRENNADTISMVNGVVTVGSSTDKITINGTSGITIRENNKDNISLTNGTIKIGVDENNGAFAQLDGSTLDFITDSSGTNTTRASIGATTTIGNTSTEHIKVTATKFELKRGSEVFVSASSAGLYTSGSINASSGEIAGYSITDGTIEKKSGDAGVTIDGNNSRIIISGSTSGASGTSGNSVRLFGDSGVIEVSQSGAGVFDTGRTKVFTTNTFIEPQIFKPGGISKGYVSSSITVTEPAPTMKNIDITGNMEVGGLTKTDKLMVDSTTLSTPFVFEHQISRANAATNTDGAVNPTASFAAIHSTNYSGNSVDTNCHPAFVFSADYFTELGTTDNSVGWVQNGSPPSGSNIFTIAATVKDVDNSDFADAKFNVLGLEANTAGVENALQNQYTFLQAKHSGSVRLQIQHDGDVVSKGNLTAFGTSFLTVSDEREKKDIYQISESLDKVLELRPTKFTWKETNKQDVGFIAQEVEKVIPEVIETSRGFINTDNDKERKTIAYPKLVPYLVDTIQVLTKRIEELEKKVK